MKLSYGKQFINKDDINEVIKCLNSRNLTQGPRVAKFEERVAKYVGAKYAVAVSNCTAGLHISLLAAGFKKGDKLLTSVISFVSSANASQYIGGKVDFIDIDLNSISMNLNELKKKIDKTVKVIMPVHMAGAAYNEKEVFKIAKKNKIKVIEDCAHGLGGSYQDGSKIGSCKYSDMSVFSFHPVKSITTGEGGMITTNNKKLYENLLRLRSHGINKNNSYINNHHAYTGNKKNSWYYEMNELGFNYRLTDIQSALGISQLKKLNSFIIRRREISKYYDKAFSKIYGINLPQYLMRNKSASHLYILRIDFKKYSTSRQKLFDFLKKHNVICQVHYIPIVMHPYYIAKGYNLKNYPNAKKYYEECISIPCFYSLKKNEQKRVEILIKNFLFKKNKIKVLLFGGSGLLGGNILKYQPSRYKILSYINNTKINSNLSENVQFKLNRENLTKFIKKNNISIIINVAGYVSLEKCEQNKKIAFNANSKIVDIICKSIKGLDVKFIHMSTDHIFRKKDEKINENKKFLFKNFYSKTKFLAESYIKNSKSNTLIIRANFFGKGKRNRNSYSDFIIKNLKKKIYTPIWKNIYFSPVNLNFLSKCIFDLISINAQGIYNVSSNEKITKFKFAIMIANLLKLDKKFLISKKFDDSNEKINRPLNMSLDNKKLINIFPNYKYQLNLKNQINKEIL